MTRSRISSFISKSATISLLMLALTASPAAAQKKTMKAQAGKKTVKMTEQNQTDSIALLRGVAVSADLIGLAQIAFSDYGQYEAAARVNLKDRYFPVVEIGYGKADADDPSTKLRYKTSAPYWRVGLDFNIAKNKHDDYRIYAGFRYAMTYYKFDVSSTDLKDPVWGDDVQFGAEGVKANYHWMEGVFGVDAKIAGPLRLGWSFRYRRRIAHNDGTMGGTWYVPGYGKQGGSRMSGTFNVIFEI